MNARILITGANGQLGRELARTVWPMPVELSVLNRNAADLAVRGSVAAAIEGLRPALVVNAAAYTAVDRAEAERDLAYAVNAEAPGEIAAVTARMGIPMVHVSTDYVFDGTKSAPYVEEDAIAPLGVYGASKAQGESAVRAGNPLHLILRTSWVYGAEGQNFVRTMLRLGAEREELKVVDDQIGAPSAAFDLAGAIARISPELFSGAAAWGTYHLTGRGKTSWHGFAEAIFADMAMRSGRRPRLTPIPTSAYPTPAKRPANSVLDNAKFRAAFGFALPDWKESLTSVLSALHEARA